MAGMVPVSSRDFECPVCHEAYTEPKMLPCTHLACRKCVVSLLDKGDEPGGCPLCRTPIISTTTLDHNDLMAKVDSLPTDLATVALVESHKVLTGPHTCRVCENNVIATSFCMQCDAKLCMLCSKGHTKLPALKNHVTEELCQLTPQRLAAYYLSTCKSHDDRKAEFYCSAHHELICMLCSSTDHRTCVDVKAIVDMAREKRAELKLQAQRLRERETSLTTQIREFKDRFKVMRKKAKDIFDDIQQNVKRRRMEINALIQAEEDAVLASLTQMERNRSAVKSNASTVEKLVNSAPDVALLDMLSKLATRLNDLELQTGTTDKVGAVVDVAFEPQKLNHLKSIVSSLGRVTSKTRTRHSHSAKTNP